jgi:hypothetical protein
MIKTRKIKLIVGLFVFVVFFWISKIAFAQESLRYPIPSLGYCRDAKECYLYCEIPENEQACWSYGTNVLGERVLGVKAATDDIEAQVEELGIAFPVAELGNCTSVQSCFDYCELPQNQISCSNFAQRYGLGEPPDEVLSDAEKEQLLVQAEEVLGCNSMQTCETYCAQNEDQCEEFVRVYAPDLYQAEYEEHEEELGVDMDQLLVRAEEELGCNSMETCEAYCEQNEDQCVEFLQTYAPDLYEEEYAEQEELVEVAVEELGCDSQETCETFCSNPKNSSACAGFTQQHAPEYYQEQTTTLTRKQEMVRDAREMIGCDSEASCMQVCSSPENAARCAAFESKYGVERSEPPPDEGPYSDY